MNDRERQEDRHQQRRQERRHELAIAACFLGAALGGVALAISFWMGLGTQALGASGGVAFLLLAIGLVRWSHHLMPEGPFQEPYPELPSGEEDRAEVLASLDRGEVGRRRLLLGTLGTAGVAVGAGLLSTVRSIGPAPASLANTPWRDRLTLVTEDGSPVHVTDVPTDSIVTVFPAGFTSSPQVSALLIHLRPGVNQPLPGRDAWAPNGLVCYSKVCSHAGCAVGLYNRLTHELACPCHQSTFNVAKGAKPVFGPAGGPLVQLPIRIEPDGTMRSTGDFSGPPGPVFWHRS